jgi:phosphatidylserine decarboxylase
MMRDTLFILLQHVLPQHFLSRGVLRLTRVSTPRVKNVLISRFVRQFRPDLSEAAQSDPLSYGSFNEFFTRTLRAGVRPVDPDPQIVVSPVDGTVSQIGSLDGSRLVQAKGHDYTLEALLAAPARSPAAQWPERFRGGSFATLYLAPYNYHRIHMPMAGTLRAAWFVPGRLFSVNTATAASVPNLFARNERVVCIFEEGPTAFAMVLVGALFVGSIATVWHGDITPRDRRGSPLLPDSSRSPLHLEKGAEMGRFNMGSTVILLTPPGFADWLPGFTAGSRVRMGEALARTR